MHFKLAISLISFPSSISPDFSKILAIFFSSSGLAIISSMLLLKALSLWSFILSPIPVIAPSFLNAKPAAIIPALANSIFLRDKIGFLASLSLSLWVLYSALFFAAFTNSAMEFSGAFILVIRIPDIFLDNILAKVLTPTPDATENQILDCESLAKHAIVPYCAKPSIIFSLISWPCFLRWAFFASSSFFPFNIAEL